MGLDLKAEFLQRRPANFRPMTPVQFLRRAADVFPDRTAVIHGDIRYTWREHDLRCRLLASGLRRSGVGAGRNRGSSLARIRRRCWKRISAFRCPGQS